MKDFIDQLHLLFGAWKPLVLCLAFVAGLSFFFGKTIYERQIETIKAERDGLKTDRDSIRADRDSLRTERDTLRASATATQPGNDQFPLQWGGPGMTGGPLMRDKVREMQYYVWNKSKEPVTLKRATIVSGVDGTSLDLKIFIDNELVSLNEVGAIPGDARVQLVVKFGTPDPGHYTKVSGIEPSVFIQTWRQFTPEAEDNKRTYSLPVSEGFMSMLFPGMVGPRIVRKSAP